MNTPSDELQPKRGRPRDPERMRRVLEAANHQFLEFGFAATSMEAIAKASGISKMTIYNYFPTKEALFETCVATRTDQVFEFATFYQKHANPLPDPQQTLSELGAHFLALMRDEEVLSIHRVMIASANQHPDVCQSFYEQGCLRLNAQVKRYLSLADERGLLQVSNPQRAADQFLSMFLGRQHLRTLLNLGHPSADEDAEMVRDNVAMFLRAYQPIQPQ
ncbi:MAG: TetR/AcrR family transcriptional regulator [Pseudomonadota bacterium]|nr:TetR/AcrR family transcriptional regulator [Pseudomonadota bacterium]